MEISAKRRFEFLNILRWVARVSSILSILILAMFFVGESFDLSKVSPRQWVGFAFFPLGLIMGMIVGWKWEALGGIISLVSLVAFYIVYGAIISGRLPGGWGFPIFAIPGLLFLLAGIYARTAIGRSTS